MKLKLKDSPVPAGPGSDCETVVIEAGEVDDEQQLHFQGPLLLHYYYYC